MYKKLALSQNAAAQHGQGGQMSNSLYNIVALDIHVG